MDVIQKNFLKPGVYRFGKRLVEITKGELRKIANATNRMLKQGIAVPLLDGHADPGKVGPGVGSRKASEGVGWIKYIQIEKDGCLSQRLNVTDTGIREKAQDGSIRFSSPEIGAYVDGTGKDHGTVIRHMALTPAPRNPDQGELMCLQLSEDDYVGGSTADDTISFSEMEKQMATKEFDILSTLVKAAKAKGITIPEDGIALTNEDEVNSFMDLITAAKQLSEDDDEGKTKKDETQDGPNGLTPREEKNLTNEAATNAGFAGQYSEDRKADRAEIDDLKSRLDAKDQAAARANIAGQIERSTVAPAIKKALSARASNMQFSEVETAMFSVPEILTLCEEAYKGIAFSEDGKPLKSKDEPHPEGTEAFSEEDNSEDASPQYTNERLTEINKHFNKPQLINQK